MAKLLAAPRRQGDNGSGEVAVDVQVQIPDDVALVLGSGEPDMPRAILEALALEGYRSGRLSDGQVRRTLGLDTRLEVHAFLKEHGVPLNYSVADLEQDIQSLSEHERKRSA